MSKTNVPAKSGINLKTHWENIREYFILVYGELKKVHWPNRRQMLVYTGVVLVMVAIMSVIIGVFDSVLSYLLETLFKAFGK